MSSDTTASLAAAAPSSDRTIEPRPRCHLSNSGKLIDSLRSASIEAKRPRIAAALRLSMAVRSSSSVTVPSRSRSAAANIFSTASSNRSRLIASPGRRRGSPSVRCSKPSRALPMPGWPSCELSCDKAGVGVHAARTAPASTRILCIDRPYPNGRDWQPDRTARRVRREGPVSGAPRRSSTPP